MTAWLIGGVWAAVLVLAPFVGRLIRTGRRDPAGPPVMWDHSGDAWDRNRDGTYRPRGRNSDGHLQHQDYDDVDQAFGPITLTPPAEQDPTT